MPRQVIEELYRPCEVLELKTPTDPLRTFELPLGYSSQILLDRFDTKGLRIFFELNLLLSDQISSSYHVVFVPPSELKRGTNFSVTYASSALYLW